MTDPPDEISLAEFATAIGGTHSFVFQLVKAGHIKARILNPHAKRKTWRIPRSELTRFREQSGDHPAIQLLRDEAVTISMSGDLVRLHCENCDDAETLFDWLIGIVTDES